MEKEKYTVQHWNVEDKKQYKVRLNKIQGQVGGITKMLEESRRYEDILIQLSSINQSIKSLGQKILIDHMKECIKNSKEDDDYEFIDETMNSLKKFI